MNAIISVCGEYRYTLTREFNLLYSKRASVLFVMLNPSTADSEMNDPTIRRCLGFAKKWDCAKLTVVNLYAFRATDPIELFKAKDPVGVENNSHLRNELAFHGGAICAWGNNAKENRVREFTQMAKKAGTKLWHLGLTKGGQPRHPLYIKASQKPILWEE